MNKIIKFSGLLPIIVVLCFLVFGERIHAQSNLINTGVTINKATNVESAVFAGARLMPTAVGSNTKPFSLTLNFSGGPVAGNDLNMDVYIVAKKGDGTMNKVATFNFNENACTRRCYDLTIPVSTSKWGNSVELPLWQVIKVPFDLAPGNYTIRVALRRGNTYAKFTPGTGVVEYNDTVIDSSPVPSYEVASFSVVTPCVSSIDSHYSFNTNTRYVENGYTGPEVSILQNIFKTMGFYDRAVTGAYDSETVSATKRYQKSKGLPETGVLGSMELNSINQYCNNQITPVITKLSPKKVVSGDTITIEGKNFFSKNSNGKSVGTEINEGAQIVSVTPTKITAKVYGSEFYGSKSFDGGIVLKNLGLKSEAMPITFTWVGGTAGQPIIQKINGQIPQPGQALYVGKPGSTLVIEGKDFNVGKISKVVFSVGDSKTADVGVDLLSFKNSEIAITVPNTLTLSGQYRLKLADSSGKQIGSSVLVYTDLRPAVNEYYKKIITQGETINLDVYNYNRNLELHLSDINEKNEAVHLKPSSIVPSNLPAPYLSYARFTFAVPQSVPAGKYNFVLKDGDMARSQISKKYDLTILAKDVTPPTVPGKPVVTKINSSSVRLNWSPSTDSSGVEGYHVYLNGNNVMSTAKNEIVMFAYYDFTARLFSVSAYDKVGNVSAKSEPALYQIPKPTITSISKSSLQKMEEFEIVGTNLLYENNFVGYVVIDPTNTGGGANLQTTVRQGRLFAQVPRVPFGEHKIAVKTAVGTSNVVKIDVVPSQEELLATPEITSVVYDAVPTYGYEASTRYIKITGKNLDAKSRYVRLINIKNEKGELINYGLKEESPTSLTIYTGTLPDGKYSLTIKNAGGSYDFEARQSNTWTFEAKSRTAPVTAPVTTPAVSTPIVPVVSPVKVPVPVISSVLPLSARVNDTVTLSGSNFTGVNPDLVTISNSTGSMSVGTLYVSTATAVVFKLPNLPAGVYNVELTANGGTSNKVTLTVLAPIVERVSAPRTTPYIASISPSGAKPGALVTVTGSNFQGVTADLLFIENTSGSISPEIVSSSATSIVFKVPNMPAGSYKVYLFADMGESNQANFTVQNALTGSKGYLLVANVLDRVSALFGL
jgi:peptidoglycan hydrolase-like protein with peptidoglycan-binding domain